MSAARQPAARRAAPHTNSRSGNSAGASSIQAYTPAVAHCVTSLTQTEPQPTSTKSRSSAPVPQPARRAAVRQPEPPRRRRAPRLARSPASKPWAPCPGFGTDPSTQTHVALHQDGTPLGSPRHDMRVHAPAPVPCEEWRIRLRTQFSIHSSSQLNLLGSTSRAQTGNGASAKMRWKKA